tara:strand:- start:197 stop:334 length:138 start_codon:yes stop_codon:yes gene_type:complete
VAKTTPNINEYALQQHKRHPSEDINENKTEITVMKQALEMISIFA